jgi:hypothetical protein
VNRLQALYPEPKDDETYARLVERLFEITMVLPCQGEGKLMAAVLEVGWRAGLLGTDLGDWVRAERRRYAWEKYGASKA